MHAWIRQIEGGYGLGHGVRWRKFELGAFVDQTLALLIDTASALHLWKFLLPHHQFGYCLYFRPHWKSQVKDLQDIFQEGVLSFHKGICEEFSHLRCEIFWLETLCAVPCKLKGFSDR
uniref:Uncharacterized protein n=1 Tax=Oryza brachyantha TaxID=4533 RepID=J3NE91_ORYBR